MGTTHQRKFICPQMRILIFVISLTICLLLTNSIILNSDFAGRWRSYLWIHCWKEAKTCQRMDWMCKNWSRMQGKYSRSQRRWRIPVQDTCSQQGWPGPTLWSKQKGHRKTPEPLVFNSFQSQNFRFQNVKCMTLTFVLVEFCISFSEQESVKKLGEYCAQVKGLDRRKFCFKNF